MLYHIMFSVDFRKGRWMRSDVTQGPSERVPLYIEAGGSAATEMGVRITCGAA